ncbi:acyl-CoA thioesterase [Leptolyngbya iicbica]|uniref:1,4-dihydroxy-2-naphthoyl-CoA hydrolase n=2 Tax=Cyanophyceae TaxID=3028117 RepID=A0A4Q7EGW9_9CYAN|nr:acyl-CoA thioesterase [Leptolyngbya sp. LK]RZM82532.1 acyl-CoA thioesterase [Leptolyngbya sp. LK]
MTFDFLRTIRFQDTDAAGVVYFARLLSICHEAYEASLQASGIDLKTFFSRGAIAVPITHTAADFHRPLLCGDEIIVRLTPTPTGPDSFEIAYQMLNAGGKSAAIATTRHVCIETATRQRHPLTPELTQWLQQWSPTDSSPTAATPPD